MICMTQPFPLAANANNEDDMENYLHLTSASQKQDNYHGTTVELQWLEHWWLIYHGCFELVLESLGKNPLTADLG